MSVPPEVGDLAPMFTLASTEGEISLDQLAQEHKVVLAFYKEDLTPG